MRCEARGGHHTSDVAWEGSGTCTKEHQSSASWTTTCNAIQMQGMLAIASGSQNRDGHGYSGSCWFGRTILFGLWTSLVSQIVVTAAGRRRWPWNSTEAPLSLRNVWDPMYSTCCNSVLVCNRINDSCRGHTFQPLAAFC